MSFTPTKGHDSPMRSIPSGSRLPLVVAQVAGPQAEAREQAAPAPGPSHGRFSAAFYVSEGPSFRFSRRTREP